MRAPIIISLLVLAFINTRAQKTQLTYPEVGKPMPEFILKNIAYFPKKEASLKDFGKKWLVLDFWNRDCGACVASFPKINTIQKRLGEKVQIMLVGIQDPGNTIQKIYSKFREKEQLVIPCAFDSSIAKRFDIYTSPHIIIIDDKGIVQCITYTLDTSAMRGFLDGRHPILPKSYRRMHDDTPDSHIAFDYMKPLMIDGNGANDTDFLFRSLLSKYDRNIHQQWAVDKIQDFNVKQGLFQTIGVRLEWLLECAYIGQYCSPAWDRRDSVHYGKYYHRPLLEIKDSSKFNGSFDSNKDLYSYSLSMPPAICTRETMEAAMQRDIETYFGFIGSIETRKCPYWRLVALPGTAESLRTQGGPSVIHEINHASITARNIPFSQICDWIRAGIPDYISDETCITGNVDVSFDCIPTHIDDLQQALRKAGLDLVPAEKDMKVLVIRDAKPPAPEGSGNVTNR